MSKSTARSVVFACTSLMLALPAGAQTPAPPEQNAPPALLQIEREEVRPGKAAAHAVSEAAWASAYVKAQSPVHWLGMTTIAGPTEAWFLTSYASFEEYEKADTSSEGLPGLAAERDRISAADGDLLSRSSTIFARYRPALSYQPTDKLPSMRYMTVNLMRVKPGKVAEFMDGWRMIVAAHKKASMDEHWAVYQVESGMPDATFLFLYARKSLAEVDAAGPMHGADGYRDAVGDGGRRQMNEVMANCIDMTQTLHFRLRPAMSALPKVWSDTDTYWAPPAPATAALTADRKKGKQ